MKSVIALESLQNDMAPSTIPADPVELATQQCLSLHRLKPLSLEALLSGALLYEERVDFDDRDTEPQMEIAEEYEP